MPIAASSDSTCTDAVPVRMMRSERTSPTPLRICILPGFVDKFTGMIDGRVLPACTGLALAGLPLACGFGARDAGAQAIRTTLLGAGSREPVPGAFVVATDSMGREVARTLTDEAGRVSLDLVAGSYRLLVLRIGVARWRTAAFSLATGDTMKAPIEAPETPVLLSAIAVHADRRCRLEPEEGSAAATLWEEARKALEATEWTIAHPVYRFQERRYVREFDPAGNRTFEERRESGGYSSWPFVSLAAESLAAGGFAQADSLGATTYYGPDLPVLLSESFLARHCFRVQRRTADAPDSLLGLEFEPVAARGHVDIAGVLWLARSSAELRELEFHYTNLGRWAGRGAVGRVAFERLPNRAWVIRRWSIRMPIPHIGRKPLELGGLVPTNPIDTIDVAGYREEGGWVTVVRSATGRTVAVYPDEP
jgi:carboxypeptidase family protein